jgi:hypothetical protein
MLYVGQAMDKTQFTNIQVCVNIQMRAHVPLINTVTCRVVRVTKMTGSSSDDWIY